MKEFNWEEFKDKENKIAVHCETEEQAEKARAEAMSKIKDLLNKGEKQ